MSKAEIVNAFINGLIALGTILVAVLAIWGDRIRSWFVGPRLALVL